MWGCGGRAPRPESFAPREEPHAANCTEGCLGPRSCLDVRGDRTVASTINRTPTPLIILPVACTWLLHSFLGTVGLCWIHISIIMGPDLTLFQVKEIVHLENQKIRWLNLTRWERRLVTAYYDFLINFWPSGSLYNVQIVLFFSYLDNCLAC